MGSIKVLDKHVAELIAAGEVVERPSSVVKELLENALDAGATAIDIEIRRGGISFIRVTDNGCGIAREDVAAAFLRHATSKVSTEEDLEKIATLGFRGEALASIAAVAKVEMLTRVKGEMAGTRYLIEGGEEVLLEEAGCPDGTTLIVRDLFYNTPARLKFLKKDFTEANYVAATVDRLALSHPEVSVRFVRDGKIEMQTPGNGRLHSAIYAVLGGEFADGLIEAEDEFEGVRVWGYVSKPEAARPNRNMQFFFVNGRLVKSGTCSAAIEQAFRGSIMAGRFPACVLHVEMHAGAVDCNIHPAKVEVRFLKEETVFRAVYNAAKSALLGDMTPLEMKMPEEKAEEAKTLEETEPAEQLKIKPAAAPEGDKGEMPAAEGMLYNRLLLFDFSENQDEEKKASADAVSEGSDVEAAPQIEEEKGEAAKAVFGDAIDAEPKILGEAFGTYIVVERGDELVFIDKHAAHERLIYEKLVEGQGKGAAQMLLAPLVVSLEKTEYNAVIENLDLFEEAGFDIEDFGSGTVLVRAAPLLNEGEDISAVVAEIAGDLLLHDREMRTEKLEWVYSSVACRAAVKAGDKSSPEELLHLYLLIEKNPNLRHCPHGRPVAITISKGTIEKQFGRV